MTLPNTDKNRIILITWVLALSLVATAYVARAGLHLVSRNYNIAAEANGMNGILRVADGKSLYAPKSERPYTIYLYPPLQGWLMGTGLRALGISSLSARVLWVRVLSLCFLVGAFYLLWRFFAAPHRIARWAFLLSVLLVLPKFADYATTTRNDMFSLFLEVSALVLFSRWWSTKREGYIFAFLFTCLASVATRQTGVVALGTGLVWLALHRQWGTALWLAGVFSGLVAASVYAANEITAGAFMDQAFYANLRYLPAHFQVFSLSLITFLLSYVAFVLLAGKGFQNMRALSAPLQLAGIGTALSGLMALALFFRAGGDVNYFFETLLLAAPFAALTIQKFGESRFFKMACALQMVLVACILFAKTRSASQTAFYEYAEAAERLRLEFEPFGIVDGSLAPALNLHLRDWAYHGPDVTNGGNLGRYSHERNRWVMGDTAIAFRSNKVHTIVVAQPDCANHITRAPALPISRKRWLSFSDAQAWYPWLCVYRRPHDPTGKPVEITSLGKTPVASR